MTFIGRTRVTPGTPAPGQEAEAARHAGRVVEELDYEAFEPMAIRVLDEIADEIEERFGVRRVAIVHRTGVVPLGESSIVVVAVAPHRDAAFAAARYAIDETKARAPIWKAERFERRPRLDRRGRSHERRPRLTGATGTRRAPAARRADPHRSVPPRAPFVALPAIGRPPYCGHAADRGAGAARGRSWLAQPRSPVAWGATAAASTSAGQERAILRLFGVAGIDRAGHPLAAEVVDR